MEPTKNKARCSLLQQSVMLIMCSVICSGDICNDFPPGKYCLEDLSGYHDCQKDSTTGHMTDKVHKCKGNTRCSCFYGPACPKAVSDPCHVFRTPPVFPKRFSLIGSLKVTVCNGKKCTTRVIKEKAFMNQEDDAAQKFRFDKNVQNHKVSDIFHQKSGSKTFSQYEIHWHQKKCKLSEWPSGPSFHVDPRSTYLGKEMVGNKDTEKWLWINGGHGKQDSVRTILFYIWKNSTTEQYQPVKLTISDKDPELKYSMIGSETFIFNSDFKEQVFELPDTCGSILA